MSRPENKFTCAHYVSKYLPLTENWIYRIIINHKLFRPIFLSRKKQNLNLFPIQTLYCLEDKSRPMQYAEILHFVLFRFFRMFYYACNNEQVNILHVHFGYHGVKSIGLQKKLGVPMICSFYGDDAFAFKYQNLYHRLFTEADRILVLGQYMKARLVQLGCNEDKISIHHLGIDVHKIAFRQRVVQPGQPIRFLIASSFLPKKGIDLAVKALGRYVVSHTFTIDIIGDGPLKDDIVRLLSENNLTERTTLHGYKPYDFFIEKASQCDVFIQASRTTEDNNKEGTPMAIVDAMATGMIVVSTRHSDIPEIVLDGKTGFLAEENDLESLVTTFGTMFENTSRFPELSQRGRNHVEREFDARTQTAKLEVHYQELINTNRQKLN